MLLGSDKTVTMLAAGLHKQQGPIAAELNYMSYYILDATPSVHAGPFHDANHARRAKP